MALHQPWHRRMTPRDATEAHRGATPLELFFDLCFVVSVAQVSGELHHYLSEGRAADALPSYFAVFFAIWWAWMGLTWFASAYDTDDVPYRIAVLVSIAGVLLLAAGVPRAFERHDFALATTGYAVMRLAMISLWLRAAHSHPAGRGTAHRFAAGLLTVQALWLGWLALPTSVQMPVFAVVALLDLAVPVASERAHPTPWHPEHIAERYGLFTMIVLGESVLSATTAVREAVDTREAGTELYGVAGGGLLTVFAMWWLYFAKPAAGLLVSTRMGFFWGYGHYLVFRAAAAVGAGLAVNVDFVTHHSHLSHPAAAAALTLPVAVFLLTLWLLHLHPHHIGHWDALLFPATALLIVAATFTAAPVLTTGLLMAALVAAAGVLTHRSR